MNLISSLKIVSLSVHFDGQSIQLDEPYPIEPNTKLIVTLVSKQISEQETWFSLSSHHLNNAYSDEDKYPGDALK
ncbi:hypothetical protein NG796_05560 [Laspinema sp. A4]|uniref:hypothetical protein n=1 Tax=Laspinema sp. D2d TaxID=2953686 RepID=UPI0021BAC2A7|nr:hypothetical protein [Laspinema sp. D2d]MCT7982758.1 hypothetical protein [Laspinema sp. D2d]